MGCTNTKDAVPKNEAKAAAPTESPQDLERKKQAFFKKGEELFEKDEYGAIDNFQDAYDIEVFLNYESDLAFQCVSYLARLYSHVSLNHVRPYLFMKRVVNYLSYQVITKGNSVREFAEACRENAKALRGREKLLKAILYIEIALALGDKETKVKAEIVDAMKEDDQKVYKGIEPDLANLAKAIKSSKGESEATVEIYLKIAKRISTMGKHSDAIAYLRRALLFHTFKNFESLQNGKSLGLICFEMGKYLKARNKGRKACCYLLMAQKLLTEGQEPVEAMDLHNKINALDTVESSKAIDQFHQEISDSYGKNKTETNTIFVSYVDFAEELLHKERFDEAKFYLYRALDYFALYNPGHKNKDNLGVCCKSLGRIYRNARNQVKAQFYLERAFPLILEDKRKNITQTLIDIYKDLKASQTRFIIPNVVKKAIQKEDQKKNATLPKNAPRQDTVSTILLGTPSNKI